jgi:CDP-diacylglycerol pyrophosphatase
VIPVPPNTVQIDGDGTVHNDFNGSFFLTWLGSHNISHNGVPLVQTNNQKQVSVHSSCEHWTVRNALGYVTHRDGQRVVPLQELLHPQYVRVAVNADQLSEESDIDEEEESITHI